MDNLNIIKIGGQVIDEVAKLSEFLINFTRFPGNKILVHGGGKIADDLLIKLGIKPKVYNGRRVTDEDTLRVVQMVYAGLINKSIVSQMQKYKCAALGMSGADANSILSKKRETADVDFGFVGDIISVNANIIHQFITIGLTPVFCALTHDGKGQILNTNADTIAAELGIALSKIYNISLIYCIQKAGVLQNINDEQSVIPGLTFESYSKIKEKGLITAGMIPKIDNAFNALHRGVKQVWITSYNSLGKWMESASSMGTKITLT